MGCVSLDYLIRLILPAGRSSVEAVAEVILWKVVLDAVEGELTLGDTVRIAAD